MLEGRPLLAVGPDLVSEMEADAGEEDAGVHAAPLDCGKVWTAVEAVCEETSVKVVLPGAAFAGEVPGTDPLGPCVGAVGESAEGVGTSAPWTLLLDPWLLQKKKQSTLKYLNKSKIMTE